MYFSEKLFDLYNTKKGDKKIMKFIIFIFKIPLYIIKFILKIFAYLFKLIFGFLFGWIPDFDERMSGEEFEQYVKEILKRNGFQSLELTKRSGDYGVDILGKYRGKSYAIQCKKYAKPVGVAAVQQAYSGCQYYECDIAVVVTNHHFTTQALALANTNQVELWDGDYLNYLKRKANARSLFHRKFEESKEHPYYDIIELLLNEGYASTSLLVEHFHYSQEKAFYILEDLEFHDLVSEEDHLGVRDLYFLSQEEAIDLLNH